VADTGSRLLRVVEIEDELLVDGVVGKIAAKMREIENWMSVGVASLSTRATGSQDGSVTADGEVCYVVGSLDVLKLRVERENMELAGKRVEYRRF
jgi:hypothetical protein